MTRDQAQVISFDKIYNLDNYGEIFCRMNRSSAIHTLYTFYFVTLEKFKSTPLKKSDSFGKTGDGYHRSRRIKPHEEKSKR